MKHGVHVAADIAERVIWTFLQTFGAELVASDFFTVPGVVDLSLMEKAGIAGLAATLSMLKGLVASKMGMRGSAATLPADVDSRIYVSSGC